MNLPLPVTLNYLMIAPNFCIYPVVDPFSGTPIVILIQSSSRERILHFPDTKASIGEDIFFARYKGTGRSI